MSDRRPSSSCRRDCIAGWLAVWWWRGRWHLCSLPSRSTGQVSDGHSEVVRPASVGFHAIYRAQRRCLVHFDGDGNGKKRRMEKMINGDYQCIVSKPSRQQTQAADAGRRRRMCRPPARLRRTCISVPRGARRQRDVHQCPERRTCAKRCPFCASASCEAHMCTEMPVLRINVPIIFVFRPRRPAKTRIAKEQHAIGCGYGRRW